MARVLSQPRSSTFFQDDLFLGHGQKALRLARVTSSVSAALHTDGREAFLR
jgi:hypothetical protein